jgi:hypothetical protein
MDAELDAVTIASTVVAKYSELRAAEAEQLLQELLGLPLSEMLPDEYIERVVDFVRRGFLHA